MNRRSLIGILICSSGLILASAGSADDMRCGSDLVSTGDSSYAVRATCGEPDSVAQHVEYRTVREYVNAPCAAPQTQPVCGRYEERSVQVVVDQWTYDRGPDEFVRVAVFEQDKLRNVEIGPRGRKKR